MNAQRHNLTNVLATGVVATILVLAGLFWARTLCGTLRHDWLFQSVPELRVGWSSPFLWERESDPNVGAPYSLVARLWYDPPLIAGLGVMQYMLSRIPTFPQSHVYHWNRPPDGDRLHYDQRLGQMVYEGTKSVTNPDGRPAAVPFSYYAGPKGVALVPNEKLGGFDDPIVDPLPYSPMVPLIVYDRGLARFFRIDWTDQTVKEGPPLPPSALFRPVQIGVIEKNPQCCQLLFQQAERDRPGRLFESDEPGNPSAPLIPEVVACSFSWANRIPVLDASGRIDLLDTDTLELVRGQMYLPAPAGLYSRGRSARPEDVAAYSVLSISSHPRGESGVWTYTGCAVATLSRDGTAVRLEVFDPYGRTVASAQTSVPQYTAVSRRGTANQTLISSPEAAYHRLPGAYGLTLVQFAVESLHPPILHFLSYFGASHFEATAGGRTLLLLPDSFLAMATRANEHGPVDRFLTSMLFLIPGLFVVLLLAWRVSRDGGRLGLSKNARTAWIVGTVFLGLPAYLTYRLTRPKATLVTCANCGLGRRPDQDKCHRCGSLWTVPELTPPAWRVIGEPESVNESLASQTSPQESEA